MALFLPWANRRRKAHGLRIRVIDAIHEVQSSLDSAMTIVRRNPLAAAPLTRNSSPGLGLLEGLASQYDLLTPIEQMQLLDLTGFLRIMVSEQMNADRHRAKFRRGMKHAEDVLASLAEADRMVGRLEEIRDKAENRHAK